MHERHLTTFPVETTDGDLVEARVVPPGQDGGATTASLPFLAGAKSGRGVREVSLSPLVASTDLPRDGIETKVIADC